MSNRTAAIKYSNEPSWIGCLISIKKDDEVEIKKEGIFTYKTIANYPNNEVTNFKIENTAFGQSSGKSALGSVGGAVIGGVLTGGFGAVVGSVAGGNKTNRTRIQSMCLQFKDGKWLVVEFEFDGSFISDCYENLLKEYTKRFSTTMASPFSS